VPRLCGQPACSLEAQWVRPELRYKGEPIRPAGDAIGVWLRGYTKAAQGYPFKADFDDFAMQRA
jgi:hypothetical protein